MYNKSNRILVLKGQSQYDVMRIFADSLIEGFKKLGRPVDVVDFQQESYHVDLIDAIIYQERDHYQFVFSFNGIYRNYRLKNREYLFDNYGTLYYTFLVDHPLYHHSRLLNERKNEIISCVDKNHVNYIKKYYKHIKNVAFVPHGATNNTRIHTNITDRKINIAFFGSYTNSNIIRQEFNKYSTNIKNIMEEIAQDLTLNTDTTLEASLTDYLQSNNIIISNNQFRDLMVAMNCVDRYSRAYLREKVIGSLIKDKITVHVYGKGWDSFEEYGKSHLILHGALEYNEILTIMSQTKIVLNVLPGFKNGSHERIVSALLEGAICLTDENQYIKENFENQKNVVAYSLEHLEKLPTLVKNILDNIETYETPTETELMKGNVTEHLWDTRAVKIMKQVQKVEELSMQ